MLSFVSLAILIFTFLFQIIRRFGGLSGSILTKIFKSIFLFSIFLKTDKLKLFKYIFITAVILITGLLLYQSYQQYQFWSQNEVSKYLLPPYQSINYFIFYAIARFFTPYLISLAAAVLFLIFAKAFNKKYNERFFYPEEPYFGALAIFLTSHPGWLFYIIFLILFYLLIHFFSLLIAHFSSFRISLYYLWLPAAIFVIIIINYWLQTLGWWNLLKI